MRLFTRSAIAEDVDCVARGSESVFGSYFICPALNTLGFDFHGLAALAANQMVVVSGAAGAVKQFAVFTLKAVGFRGAG